MSIRVLTLGALVGAVAFPLAALAQSPGGAAAGAAGGAAVGGAVGGPVGAVVGGAAGAVSGGLAPDVRPRFRQYVTREHRPSYRYQGDVRVGAVLPSSGVTYYEVPAEYGVRSYRYTIVNDTPVLVDPSSHRIVEVVQ